MPAPRLGVSAGFTLLEVLVAGLILFMVIATSVQIYRAGVQSSTKSTHYLLMLSEVPKIQAHIAREIRASTKLEVLSGEGDVTSEVSFRWAASPAFSGMTASEVVAEVSGGGSVLVLWRVNFEVLYADASVPFDYWELSWRSA